jgi:hypothetical protein
MYIQRMRLVARLRKARAVDAYLRRCPALLRARYGAEVEYSPARILTTLRVNGLSTHYADYACAMFAGLEDFVRWAQAAGSAAHDGGRCAHPYRHAGRLDVPPSREECTARYAKLRREVAEEHNGGVYRFLPEPEPRGEQWVPLTNERAIGPLAWLF